MNRVFLAGNLAKDPEVKETNSCKTLTTFPVAVSRQWKSNSGENQKQTCFFKIVVWNNVAKNCAKFLKKGRPVLVEGRIENHSYSADSGEKKFFTQIIGDRITFLGKPVENHPTDSLPEEQPAIF
jgi:single-strand DNA-binding protein